MDAALLKKCNKCSEIKPTTEFNKNSRIKCGLRSICRICSRKELKIWQVKNPGKVKAANHRWIIKKYGSIAAWGKTERLLKPDKDKVSCKKWRETNQDKVRAYCKTRYWAKREQALLSVKNWFIKNKGRASATRAKYNAAKLNQTPKWLSSSQINVMMNIYIDAQKWGDFCGEVFHVDHIVPLQGKFVRGLHVPWNLQVLTASENISKGNRYAST